MKTIFGLLITLCSVFCTYVAYMQYCEMVDNEDVETIRQEIDRWNENTKNENIMGINPNKPVTIIADDPQCSWYLSAFPYIPVVGIMLVAIYDDTCEDYFFPNDFSLLFAAACQAFFLIFFFRIILKMLITR